MNFAIQGYVRFCSSTTFENNSGSSLVDAALQNALGFDPDKGSINEGGVIIKDDKKGNLKVETDPNKDPENNPTIIFDQE